MFDELVGHLQVLSKVDSVIVRIWANVMARRFALLLFAGLIAVFGLGMADLAGFYQLQISLGPVWAATIVAIADFVVAALVALAAGHIKPGPEIDLAMDLRNMAIKSLQADARSFVSNPLDAAAQKLLVPAVIAMMKGLRSRASKTDQSRGG